MDIQVKVVLNEKVGEANRNVELLASTSWKNEKESSVRELFAELKPIIEALSLREKKEGL